MDDIRTIEVMNDDDVPFTVGEEKKPEALATSNTTTTLTFDEFSWLDYGTVCKLSKVAERLAKSKMIPQNFQNDTWSVMIAMEMSNRSRLPLLQVIQNMYVVNGRPSWSGKFCISAVNSCGRYEPLEFVWFHDDDGKITGCLAQAKRIGSDKIDQGSPITWDTVEGFGWNKKSGSMWNIPGQREQMYMYRAAEYFCNAYCPDVLGGMYTVESQRDISGYGDPKDNKEVM